MSYSDSKILKEEVESNAGTSWTRRDWDWWLKGKEGSLCWKGGRCLSRAMELRRLRKDEEMELTFLKLPWLESVTYSFFGRRVGSDGGKKTVLPWMQ